VRREPHGGRIGRRNLLIAFAVVFGVVLGAAAVAVALSKPASPKPHCPPSSQLCGRPPALAAPLVNETVWRSPALGWSLQYPASSWTVGGESGSAVALNSTHGDMTMVVTSARGADARALLDDRVGDLRSRTLGLQSDRDPTHDVLGPAVGYRDAVGATYAGTIDDPQGPQTPITAAFLAASEGGVTICVTVATTELRPAARAALMGTADSVLNTIAWAGR
jgi:hypothetical protein